MPCHIIHPCLKDDGSHRVDDRVSFVVVALADQPAEHAYRMVRAGRSGIEDPRLVVLAVERGDVVAGDRAPMRVAQVDIGPTLDPRKQSFDTRAIALDSIRPSV